VTTTACTDGVLQTRHHRQRGVARPVNPLPPGKHGLHSQKGEPRHERTGTRHPAIKRTRLSGLWLASTLSALVLIQLLISILENGHSVAISYFGAHGHLPLGRRGLHTCSLRCAAGDKTLRAHRLAARPNGRSARTSSHMPIASVGIHSRYAPETVG